MTGASEAPPGGELLQAPGETDDVETHLVMSKWAKTAIELKTPYRIRKAIAMADIFHQKRSMTLHNTV